MAGKSAVMQYGLLREYFNALTTHTSWAATAGTTAIWVGLYTADPTEAITTAGEGGYAAYTRAQTDRSTTTNASTPGWSVTSGAVATVSIGANLDFPQVATTTTGTFSYFALFPSSAATSTQGTYFGSLSPVINWSQNVTPRLTTSSSITED
jgi:hypothetical protein